jgi:translation initiation factor 4E
LKELRVAVPDGDDDRSVESDDEDLTQEELALKRDLRAKGPHALHYKWVLWYNPKQTPVNGEWVSNTKEVGDFDTIEDFWRLFNNLKSPHELVPGSDYHLFKHNIKPEWEDPANKRGGKWLMNFPSKKGKEQGKEQAEAAWFDTILALVGHTFPQSCIDEVTGVVISPRGKITRVAVWTRSADSEHLAMEVGRHLHYMVRDLLDQGGAEPLSYQAHGLPNKVVYTVN